MTKVTTITTKYGNWYLGPLPNTDGSKMHGTEVLHGLIPLDHEVVYFTYAIKSKCLHAITIRQSLLTWLSDFKWAMDDDRVVDAIYKKISDHFTKEKQNELEKDKCFG